MTLSTKTTRTVKNDRGAFMREKTKKRRPDEYSFQRNIHGYLLIAPASQRLPAFAGNLDQLAEL